MLGDRLLDLRRRPEALVSYRRAIELDPDNVAGHTGLSSALSWLGRDEEALAAAERAVQGAPDDSGARVARGYAYAHLARFEEALAEADHRTETSDEDRGQRELRAWVEARRGRHDVALPLIEELITEDAHSPHCWRWYATSLAVIGQSARAQTAIARAIALGGQEPRLELVQARVHLASHDYAGAESAALLSLQLAPDLMIESWVIAGALARHRGEEEVANSCFRSAISCDRASTVHTKFEFAERKALGLLGLGASGEAVRYLSSQLDEHRPGDVSLLRLPGSPFQTLMEDSADAKKVSDLIGALRSQ